MLRARSACFDRGACDRADPAVRNMTRFLAKAAEHTQGVQGELWSPGWAGPHQHDPGYADTAHWSNEQFRSVHNAQHN
eukprot:gene50304-51049_t